MSVYTDNGYKNRNDYLQCLAEDYEVEITLVITLASLLGSNEDFDGLINSLDDIQAGDGGYDED